MIMSFFNFNEKRVFYKTKGRGAPLIFLHGNTASSKIFENDIDFFAKSFQTVVVDFPGHGKSERIESFNENYWQYNAEAAIALCKELKLDKVNLLGSSGGALIALNAAVIEPGLFVKIIADSCPGEILTRKDIDRIIESRKAAKKNLVKDFWRNNHGDDWEKIVDMDEEMLVKLPDNYEPIKGNLSAITASILFTGSLDDLEIENIAVKMTSLAKKINNSLAALYSKGDNPFMLSESDKFRQIALNFLKGSI